EILALIGISSRMEPLPVDPAEAAGMSNTAWVAMTLFTRFLLPFEVAALILTVAVIAAVTLTLRKRPATKSQDPGAQSRVRARDRVRLVGMAASPRAGARPSATDGEDAQ